MQNEKCKMRRAFTLLEMIIAMTVGATMLGIAVCLLAALLRTDRVGQDRVASNAAIERLAEQFRRDVHAAQEPPVAEKSIDGHTAWRLDLAERDSVWYVVDGPAIVREQWKQHATPRRESYALPKGYSFAMTTNAVGKDISIISIAIAPIDPASPGRKLKVDAAFGRDHRFTKSRDKEKATKEKAK